MATETNGIATEGEAKSKLVYSGSVDTNKCCTKARAIAMGADSSKLSEYKVNQLVKHSDVQLDGYNIQFEVGYMITGEAGNWEIEIRYCTVVATNIADASAWGRDDFNTVLTFDYDIDGDDMQWYKSSEWGNMMKSMTTIGYDISSSESTTSDYNNGNTPPTCNNFILSWVNFPSQYEKPDLRVSAVRVYDSP